jgi:hypothetical protein
VQRLAQGVEPGRTVQARAEDDEVAAGGGQGVDADGQFVSLDDPRYHDRGYFLQAQGGTYRGHRVSCGAGLAPGPAGLHGA